jgi:nitroreductase
MIIKNEHKDISESVNVAGEYPLHPLISRRKSTRAFSEKPVEPEKLRSILEAARWAPSSSNIQPWRFIVATKEQPENYERLLGLVVEQNKVWAAKAPVLILSVAKLTHEGGERPNKFALHDVGLASANMTLQATSLGLAVHQMGGFNAEKARTVLNIPKDFEPVAMIALGYGDTADFLPPYLRERELAPRIRKDFFELAFDGVWENSWSLGQDRTINIKTITTNNQIL